MKKKIISVLLALVMVFSVEILTVNAEAEKPIITIGRAATTLIEDYETNAFTLILEESLGVDIQVEEYSEANTKLNLLVAANEKLPDVINFSLDDATVTQYGSTGVFVPLNDYFADPDLAPNFQALDDDIQKFMLSSTRMADGNNYSMPQYGVYFPNDVATGRMMINKVWLEQLGMEMPVTTEDLRAVLEAFAANDMNGNGIDDEIPMMGSYKGRGSEPIATLLNSFVNANPRTDYFYPENGVIHAAFMEDDFRTGLEYVRGLVEDGLLDVASFTQTEDQLRAIINQEPAVVGVLHARHWYIFNKPADADASYMEQWDHPIGSQYEYMEYPIGPKGGESTVIYYPSFPSQLYFITKDCADPELAFKLGDLGYDPLNSLISRHGTEGDNWTTDPEVLKDFRGAELNGVTMDPKWVLLNDPWGYAQNKHWQQQYPGYFPMDYNLYLGVPKGSKPSYMELVYAMDYDKVPDEYIGKLTYTIEEQEELSFMQTAINEYVVECMTAFVTGNMSLENEWDAYIDELKAMDVERYIEIVQAAYDRTK